MINQNKTENINKINKRWSLQCQPKIMKKVNPQLTVDNGITQFLNIQTSITENKRTCSSQFNSER